jgi:hypothetical protein
MSELDRLIQWMLVSWERPRNLSGRSVTSINISELSAHSQSYVEWLSDGCGNPQFFLLTHKVSPFFASLDTAVSRH